MTNILITGANGMLGTAVARYFSVSDNFKLITTSKNESTFLKHGQYIGGDLRNTETIEKLTRNQYDVIIHCAALTDIEFSEKNPEEAYSTNQLITENLVKTFPDSLFIYISTDSVFDGKIGNYDENHLPNPVNIYSKSKLEGETAVSSFTENHYILRTNIYGYHQPFTFRSLFEWAYHKLSSGESISGFTNVIFNPLYVGQLALVIEKFLIRKPAFGIYNAVCNEALSKYEFLQKVVRTFGFSEELLKTYELPEKPVFAQRPFKTNLDNLKISAVLDDVNLSIDTGLCMLYDDFQNYLKSNK